MHRKLWLRVLFTHTNLHTPKPHTLITHTNITHKHTSILTHAHTHTHTGPRGGPNAEIAWLGERLAFSGGTAYNWVPGQVGVCMRVRACTSGNFRGFEKPSVRPQLKFSFLRVARSWFSIKLRNVRLRRTLLHKMCGLVRVNFQAFRKQSQQRHSGTHQKHGCAHAHAPQVVLHAHAMLNAMHTHAQIQTPSMFP